IRNICPTGLRRMSWPLRGSSLGKRRRGYVFALRCTVLHCRRVQMPRYRTIRLREEDYRKMKDVQKLLRKKGTDSIDWEELRDKQDLVDLPDEDEEGNEDFGWGLLVGLGAA